ncbi:MAG: hypothetical protein KAT85_07950 [candidate division Zixibacteria bacterium]|nr:hypothetical protein [candidate division Zixibacteria bacterium]
MKKLTFLTMVMTLTILFASSASAGMMWWQITGTCACLADSANDFHLLVDVDNIDNIVIINDPCPTCTGVEITVSDEGTGLVQVDIDFIGDVVIPGAGIEMVFSTNEEVFHAEGYWTFDGEFASSSDVDFEWLPNSPLPSMTEYGMIVLALALLASGMWVYRMRKTDAKA